MIIPDLWRRKSTCSGPVDDTHPPPHAEKVDHICRDSLVCVVELDSREICVYVDGGQENGIKSARSNSPTKYANSVLVIFGYHWNVNNKYLSPFL